jgi:hypothetical protein
MQICRNSHLARLASVLAIPVLAVSLTVGGAASGRADDGEKLPHVLRDMVFSPIMHAVQGLEERLRNLETSVAALTSGVRSQQVIVQELCLADSSGAQTCITKAQLDILMRLHVQAETVQPSPAAIVEAQAEVSEFPAEPEIIRADAADAREEPIQAEPHAPVTATIAPEEQPQGEPVHAEEAIVPAPAITASTPEETAQSEQLQAEGIAPAPTAELSPAEEKPLAETADAEVVAPAAAIAEPEMARPEEQALVEPAPSTEPSTSLAETGSHDQQEPLQTGSIPSAPTIASAPSADSQDPAEMDKPALEAAPISDIEIDLDPPATNPVE